MRYKEKIRKLGELYSEYEIYPIQCFNQSSAIEKIRKVFLNDHYSVDLDIFYSCQNKHRTKRGADLPWWGKKYFDKNEQGYRIMIISQDSLSEDAGSTVLYACLMDKFDAREFSRFSAENNLPIFRSWKRAKELIMDLGEVDFMFITDAMKVYNQDSWNDNDFDEQRSKELIYKEIEFCNPDLVVLLGEQTCKLLLNKKYKDVVAKEIINSNKQNYIVAPFPSNQSKKKLYLERKDDTVKLIHNYFKEFNSF